jgi:16S rRNA processing protein RimM
LTVINEADEVLGEVKELIETGANDVLVVISNEASIDDKERLIPLVMDQMVLSIDISAREVRVAWDADW